MKLVFTLATILIAFSSYCQISINEICASNGDIAYDPDYFNFSPWIEIYNAGTEAADIGGYWVSDSESNPRRWEIPSNTTVPAKGHILIWCDNHNQGLHTNFSLDADGEDVVLSDAGGTLVDKITFPKQHLNVTYGRKSDGSLEWGYLVQPTPASANVNKSGTTALEKPLLSLKAGRYNNSVEVVITHVTPDVTIHYTVDGSEPTESSPIYSEPVVIDATRTLKAKAYKDGHLPSKAEIKTYFIGEHEFTIPVISISMDPGYMHDDMIGIYTAGTNGIPGRGSVAPVNWNQDWWRHAEVEFFKPSGEKEFDNTVDIRIFGNYSRQRPQKSFAIKARDKYGKKVIEQKIFPNKSYEKIGGFLLRNSGNDWNLTHFRDAMMQTLIVGQLDIDYQDYVPTAIYINGEYWGILNLREKIDADYFESNYGKTDIDLLENQAEISEGSNATYLMYMDSLTRIDLTDPDAIRFIERYIDVQEYINYMSAQIFYANTDWPDNNIAFWRPRDGKFRWVLWDTDFGFQFSDNHATSTHPTLEYVTTSTEDGPTKEWSTRHFRHLLSNPVFRKRFIQTLTTTTNTTFEPARVNRTINEFQNRLKNEMPMHRAKWGGTIPQWNNNVDKLRIFATERHPYLLNHIGEFFGYPESVMITTEAMPSHAGGVNVNAVQITGEELAFEYLKGLEYDIKPNPYPGYTFKQWQITRRTATKTSLVTKGDTWRYSDVGEVAAEWKSPSFDDSQWSVGTAQFGYGDGDESTVVNYGASAGSKHITTYFRKGLSIDASEVGNLRGSVLFDDGVVIYFNGHEVYRANLPDGPIAHSTVALQSIGNENAYRFFDVDKSLVVTGENVIAVEVHQESRSSNDLSFDLELSAVFFETIEIVTETKRQLTATADGDLKIVAVYEIAPPVEGLVINEFSATQDIYTDESNEAEDWIELYNRSTQPIDIAGLYITDNISNPRKHRMATGSSETIVPAGGYIVLWADEDIGAGAKHLGFKLSADGEAIGLFEERDGELREIDKVVFQKQKRNYSMSRIPNGTGPFFETPHMTPGTENVLISSVRGTDKRVSIFPNPTSDAVVLEGFDSPAEVVIYNALGHAVGSVPNVSEGESVSFRDLQSGVYILRLRFGTFTKSFRVIKL